MKIVVPLAGKDKNFEARGMIKPLTKIQGKPVIKWISESRPFPYSEAIFIILKEHDEKHDFAKELKKLFGENIKVIILDEMTEGSPQTVLKARELIDSDEELLIDLADQHLDLRKFKEFLDEELKKPDSEKVHGAIPTFESYYHNRGYMIIEDGSVKKVSEKDKIPISTHSTGCISYFMKGSDFVKYATQMIDKKRVAANGVYLPSLVYNEMIEENKKVIPVPCDFIATLGTIEGIDVFEQVNRPVKY